MSKVPDPKAWDARDAFHRATMAVYEDLGALVAVLTKERDLRAALLTLDECATPGSVPDGDLPFVANLKHAAGRLRSSLATVRKVRDASGGAAAAFGNGGSFGGISAVSHHDALAFVASEVLEPDAEGAARSGRTTRSQSASGILRRQAIAAVLDAESWLRLAENLQHEYELASLHPHSATAEAKMTTQVAPAVQVEGVDFADAMARYSHSLDDMQTVMLNPLKVIPFDNYPEETQIGHGVITRGKNVKKYVRYVLRVAAENERLVEQARSWWDWWKEAQKDQSKAGPAPLVSSRIEGVLRMAAARRGAESAMVTRAAADGPLGEGQSGQADRPMAVEKPGDGPGWQPSSHQQSVLAVLKRDGRLRTGVLWERISPKHIDVRAHQYSMRDLVKRGKVLREGKGKATEFWLP